LAPSSVACQTSVSAAAFAKQCGFWNQKILNFQLNYN
jgi:hypothetical protein